MIKVIVFVSCFATAGYAQQTPTVAPHDNSRHEVTENKARTVPGGASKGIAACHDDIERLCKAVKPGDGRVGACLNDRVGELSDSCIRWAAHGGQAHVSEALLRDLDGKSAEDKMISSYDIHAVNPYQDKISVKPLAQDGPFKLVSIALPAGQELAGHQSPVPALLLVVEGEGRFVAGAEEIKLAPGIVVSIAPGVVHRIVATVNSRFVLVK